MQYADYRSRIQPDIDVLTLRGDDDDDGEPAVVTDHGPSSPGKKTESGDVTPAVAMGPSLAMVPSSTGKNTESDDVGSMVPSMAMVPSSTGKTGGLVGTSQAGVAGLESSWN